MLGYTESNDSDSDSGDSSDHATVASLLSSSERDIATECSEWNERFQLLVERTIASGTDASGATQHYELSLALRQLCFSFAQAAAEIGAQIIREKYLPDDLRTIKPVTQAVGGIAGGEKYKYRGIFFKFPFDKFNLYGGDEFSYKTAEHELKACMAILDCRVSGLYVPLMAIVNYRGFSLIAQSHLPVNCNTVISGTADGGATVHASDDLFNEKMKLVAGLLQLKPHVVWDKSKTHTTTLYGPADLEGHLGLDGRYYVLDCARLFPPVTPMLGLKSANLYRLFRPEFLKLNPVPLSSDAFSQFGKDAISRVHNDEVRAATTRLELECIPAFAAHLDRRSKISSSEGGANPFDNLGGNGDAAIAAPFKPVLQEELSQLIADMHLHGINCRYLLLILRHVTVPYSRVLIITEVVARLCKNRIRAEWRRIGGESRPDTVQACNDDEIYIDATVRVLNHILGNTDSSRRFWAEELPAQIAMVPLFQIDPTPVARSAERELSPRELAQAANAARSSSENGSYTTTPAPAAATASHRVSDDKQLSFLHLLRNMRPHVDATALLFRLQEILGVCFSFAPFCESTTAELSNINLSELFTQAQPFTRTHISKINPKIKHINRISFEEATALSRLAAENPSRANELYEQANAKYKATIEIKPNDFRAYYNWGLSLSMQALHVHKRQLEELSHPRRRARKSGLCSVEVQRLFEEAGKKYENALIINPRDKRAYYMWANMLIQQAHSITPSRLVHIMLMRQACAKYEAALEAPDGANDYSILYNSSLACLHLATILSSKKKKKKKHGRRKDGDEQDQEVFELLHQAERRLQRAAEIRIQSVDALHNLAVTQAKIARLQSDERVRDQVYQTCYETYSLAYETCRMRGTASSESAHKILFDWGNAYYRHASCLLQERTRTKPDDISSILESEGSHAPLTDSAERCYNTAFELLLQAAEHYRAAVESKPDFLVAFINHGHTLKSMLLCKHRTDEHQHSFVRHARVFLQQFQDFISMLILHPELKETASLTLIALRDAGEEDLSKHARTLLLSLVNHSHVQVSIDVHMQPLNRSNRATADGAAYRRAGESRIRGSATSSNLRAEYSEPGDSLLKDMTTPEREGELDDSPALSGRVRPSVSSGSASDTSTGMRPRSCSSPLHVVKSEPAGITSPREDSLAPPHVSMAYGNATTPRGGKRSSIAKGLTTIGRWFKTQLSNSAPGANRKAGTNSRGAPIARTDSVPVMLCASDSDPDPFGDVLDTPDVEVEPSLSPSPGLPDERNVVGFMKIPLEWSEGAIFYPPECAIPISSSSFRSVRKIYEHHVTTRVLVRFKHGRANNMPATAEFRKPSSLTAESTMSSSSSSNTKKQASGHSGDGDDDDDNSIGGGSRSRKQYLLLQTTPVSQYATEANALVVAWHPFLAPLRFAFQHSRRLYMMYDLANCCLFSDFHRRVRPTPGDLRLFLAQLLLALEHAEQAGICSQCFEPNDVYVHRNGHVVLIPGSGLTKTNDPLCDAKAHAIQFSNFAYVAPEMASTSVASASEPHASGVWWGFGVFAYELLAGSPLVPDDDYPKLFQLVADAPRSIDFPSSLSASEVGFLSALLCRDPRQRATPKQLKGLEYFASIPWRQLTDHTAHPMLPECLREGTLPITTLRDNALRHARNDSTGSSYDSDSSIDGSTSAPLFDTVMGPFIPDNWAGQTRVLEPPVLGNQ